MVTTERRKLLERRAQFVEDIGEILKAAGAISEIFYKVNTNAGKETVELKHPNGVIKRRDITGKKYIEILEVVMGAL